MNKIYLFFLLLIITLNINSKSIMNEEIKDAFIDDYLGINIGVKYNDLIKSLNDYSIKYKLLSEDQIIINNLQNTKSDFLILNFSKNKILVDVLSIINAENNDVGIILGEIKNKINNTNYKYTYNDEVIVLTDNPLTTIEILIEKINEKDSLICIHYFYNDSKVNINNSLDIIKFEKIKNKFDIAITGGLYQYPLSLDYSELGLIYNLSDVGGFISFSNCYYLLDNFSIGYILKFNTGLLKPLREIPISNNYFYYHNLLDDIYIKIGGDIGFVTKVGKIYNKNKLLLEYGITLEGRIEINKDTTKKWLNCYLDDYFLIGPNIFIGFEHKNRYFNYTFGGIFKATFGNTMFHFFDFKYDTVNRNDYLVDNSRELLISSFDLGVEWRFGGIISKTIKNK